MFNLPEFIDWAHYFNLFVHLTDIVREFVLFQCYFHVVFVHLVHPATKYCSKMWRISGVSAKTRARSRPQPVQVPRRRSATTKVLCNNISFLLWYFKLKLSLC